jgi:soluble lytic murein transglycosylase-like protein
MKLIWILAALPALAQTGMREQMEASIAKQRAAAAIQRESVRRQFESVRIAPESAPEMDPACDPLSETAIEPIILDVAQAQSLPPKLLHAVIRQESGFHPCAVSSKGALGLMQLMPATADDLGVANAFDPRSNIEGGGKFLKGLLDRYKGDLARVLGAYNAGATTVDLAGGVPDIRETRNYVDSILRRVGN